MHEAFAVKICQGIQSALEHLTRLPLCQRPARKNMRQILLGIFHHDIKQP